MQYKSKIKDLHLKLHQRTIRSPAQYIDASTLTEKLKLKLTVKLAIKLTLTQCLQNLRFNHYYHTSPTGDRRYAGDSRCSFTEIKDKRIGHKKTQSKSKTKELVKKKHNKYMQTHKNGQFIDIFTENYIKLLPRSHLSPLSLQPPHTLLTPLRAKRQNSYQCDIFCQRMH